MARTLLKYLLFFSGFLVIIVSASIILLGPHTVAIKALPISDFIMGQSTSELRFEDVSVDNELRFYSAFFLGYGIFIISTAFDLRNKMGNVPALAGVMILAAIARMISIFFVGLPHPLFILLLGIEIVIPTLVMLLHQRAKRRLF